MKDFSIHIKSQEACNLYANGNFIGFIDNLETFSIDLKVYCTKLIITKEPVSLKKDISLPYSIKVEFLDKVSCTSELATIVPYKNQEYDIILSTSEVNSHKELDRVYDNYVEQYNLVVVNDGSSFIHIYENGSIKLSCNTTEIHNISAHKHNDLIVLKGITRNQKYYIMIINTQDFSVMYQEEVEKYEETDNEIKTLQSINDIAKHGKVYSVNYTAPYDNYSYYVYLKDGVEPVSSHKLIPYAFLEAIKVENYDLAKSYMSESLSKDTTEQHLQQYFNNLQQIHYNTYNSNDNLVNYTLLCDGKNVSCDFTIFNGKIDDIEQKTI